MALFAPTTRLENITSIPSIRFHHFRARTMGLQLQRGIFCGLKILQGEQSGAELRLDTRTNLGVLSTSSRRSSSSVRQELSFAVKPAKVVASAAPNAA